MIDEKELIEFLKKNLKITIETCDWNGNLEVSLELCGEKISTQQTNIDGYFADKYHSHDN